MGWSMAQISAELTEGVRVAFGMKRREFCAKLDVDASFYETLCDANDLSNFPPHAASAVRAMMLSLERANLERYRSRLQHDDVGHFYGAKVLHHLDKVVQLQSKDAETRTRCGPVTVEIHPSDRCNHRCPQCVNGTPFRRGLGNGLFDAHLVPNLVADMLALGVRAVNVSGGGEPLVHPELSSFLRAFKSAGIDVGLITNGTMLAHESHASALETILDVCTYCRVSVDAGSQAVYERMHGKAPDVNFQSLVQVIASMVDAKRARESKTTIGVSFLLTPDNYLDLVKAACVFRDVGVDYFQVKPIVMPAVERADAGMVFWDERLFDTLVALNAYQTKAFRVYTLGYKFADMLLNEHAGLPFSRCWGHALYPTILADGTVIVCCDMLNAHLAGRTSGTYGRITRERGLLGLWTTAHRVGVGERINTRLCPSNCKLSETNKTLERLCQEPSEHSNFIG